MKAISQVYWRSIKRNVRKFNDIKDETIKQDILDIANQELDNNIITLELYQSYIQL